MNKWPTVTFTLYMWPCTSQKGGGADLGGERGDFGRIWGWIWEEKKRLDLGKRWNVARGGLLICFHEDPTCKSYKHSNSLLSEVLVVLRGQYGYGFERTDE